MDIVERSHTPKGRKSREHILAEAEKLFASRGFHGTSMRDVAEAAGVPVAGVVYHFRKKEALYAAVLADIAADLEASLALERLGDSEPIADGREIDVSFYVTRLDETTTALVRWTEERESRVRLLLRELLDNPARVARAEKLPLAPVLTTMSAFLQAGAVAGVFDVESVETAVLHIVGGVSYVVAARPTVRRILGADFERLASKSYAREAILFARRVVGLPHDLLTTEATHGPDHRDRARPPRARAPRRANDRRG